MSNQAFPADANLKKIPPLSQKAKEELEEHTDDRATNEGKIFEAGYTEAQVRKFQARDNYRSKKNFRSNFDKLMIIGIWATAILFLIVCVVWVLNLIFPDNWRWLTTDEMSKLQGFVTGGVIATTAVGQIKKRMD
ncbi:hypothetical protein [Komagataeibacter oboediens]|uniref:hypothetical protein n=1 Tax=Komagataeibacter oboediens TaxID=65958 RepID=UPI001C2DCD0C|nr:hypothetical protein [Komagataeibacter oboediens]MBV1823337.1 hypothetical protein [Komagataeibacter oboediens]